MPIIVEPLAAAPVAPPDVAPVEPAAPAAEEGSLSDDILQIPAFQGLLAGSPPATSALIADFAKRPEGALISKNKDALLEAGIGLYKSLAGDLGVLFNSSYISGEDLKSADKEGRLTEVAPPFDEVNQQLSASGDAHPILNAQPPTGVKVPSAPSIVPPAPAAVAPPTPQKAVAAKFKNLALGSPTSGPVPGQGRILSSILKPVL